MNTEKFHCPRRAALGAEKRDEWLPGSARWGANTSWPDSIAKPRVCSCCGGVNPDDAVVLLADGWAMALSNRRYRLMLNPPEPVSILPPVKLYLAHCSREQVARADEVLRGRRAFMCDDHTHAMQ